MPPSPIRPLVDRILEGRLAEVLADWRETGVSYAGIAARMYAEHGIEVGAETIRKWCDELDIDTSFKAAAS